MNTFGFVLMILASIYWLSVSIFHTKPTLTDYRIVTLGLGLLGILYAVEVYI